MIAWVWFSFFPILINHACVFLRYHARTVERIPKLVQPLWQEPRRSPEAWWIQVMSGQLGLFTWQRQARRYWLPANYGHRRSEQQWLRPFRCLPWFYDTRVNRLRHGRTGLIIRFIRYFFKYFVWVGFNSKSIKLQHTHFHFRSLIRSAFWPVTNPTSCPMSSVVNCHPTRQSIASSVCSRIRAQTVHLELWTTCPSPQPCTANPICKKKNKEFTINEPPKENQQRENCQTIESNYQQRHSIIMILYYVIQTSRNET